MLLASQAPVPLRGENPGASVAWLIFSLVIICVALGEELRMSRERGGEYAGYRGSAPSMFPVPKLVCVVVTALMRLLLKKDPRETKQVLLMLFVVYLGIVGLLSVPFPVADIPGHAGWSWWPRMYWEREGNSQVEDSLLILRSA